MFDYNSLFLAYLILVRLAIITAGIVSIHYGYKLFAAGVFKIDMGRATTEMSGRIGSNSQIWCMARLNQAAIFCCSFCVSLG